MKISELIEILKQHDPDDYVSVETETSDGGTVTSPVDGFYKKVKTPEGRRHLVIQYEEVS